MFTSIDKLLINVKGNVPIFATGGKELFTNKTPKSDIDLCAGSRILQHFQNHWRALHDLNEQNAKSAQDVAENIEEIVENVTKSKSNIELISHIIKTVIPTGVTQCLEQLETLYTTCEAVEEKLVNLEILLDDLEFEQMVKRHKDLLADYKVKKQESLNDLKRTLEDEYQKKALVVEASKKVHLEERQKVFQEAFKHDLNVFKTLGTIPKVALPSGSQTSAILEEIQLDFDETELESFFNDDADQSNL
ncbi:hypothetical protein ABEB36_006212 [Hypothenemus hampei]|uniref:Dysbindin n=1 Tax=Hypothenemus hampei TaxID=57062 RepID=A0ABD1EPR4_HYPHA